RLCSHSPISSSPVRLPPPLILPLFPYTTLFRSPSAITAIRSDSFTRNSFAPVNTVRPWAQLAAINNTGNSSIAKGTKYSGISIRSEERRVGKREDVGVGGDRGSATGDRGRV